LRPWVHYRIAVTLLAGALAAMTGWLESGEMGPLDGLVYDTSLALTDWRPVRVLGDELDGRRRFCKCAQHARCRRRCYAGTA
jgi:hypothetical protein